MSDNIKLMRSLLDYVEAYASEHDNDDIQEFSVFLSNHVSGASARPLDSEPVKGDYVNYKKYRDVEFSSDLTTLFRFAKIYIKKAFANTSFKTIDEYGFLASLFKDKSLLKSELIQQHLLEISSGSEIIKRLVKSGLIYEYADERDKRARRIALTEKGEKEIMMSFGEMHMVSEIIIGNLTEEELNNSLAIFRKLIYFHKHLHEQDKNFSLEEIHSNYLPK
jgi:DNA-binding MarR family transcriptional regulator